jgi:hypothetical protein
MAEIKNPEDVELNTIISGGADNTFLSRYGRMHLSYLKNHQKDVFNSLKQNGTLNSYLLEIDQMAFDRLERMMDGAVKKNPPPDKAVDMMGWVRHMNMLKAQVEEFILNDLIYN